MSTITTKNGPIVEQKEYVEKTATSRRTSKNNETSEAQKRINKKYKRKTVMKDINSNFEVDKTVLVTCTFDCEVYSDDRTALKNIIKQCQQWIARLKYQFKKNDCDKSVLYKIVISCNPEDYDITPNHVHAIIFNAEESDIINSLEGGKNNKIISYEIDHLYGLEDGFQKISNYLMKQCCKIISSNGLKKETYIYNFDKENIIKEIDCTFMKNSTVYICKNKYLNSFNDIKKIDKENKNKMIKKIRNGKKFIKLEEARLKKENKNKFDVKGEIG